MSLGTHAANRRCTRVVHELSRRLDGLWRYDRYIANANGQPELQDFWRRVKTLEQENIGQLKKLVAEHVRNDWL